MMAINSDVLNKSLQLGLIEQILKNWGVKRVINCKRAIKDDRDRKILHTEFFQSSVYYYSKFTESKID